MVVLSFALVIACPECGKRWTMSLDESTPTRPSVGKLIVDVACIDAEKREQHRCPPKLELVP